MSGSILKVQYANALSHWKTQSVWTWMLETLSYASRWIRLNILAEVLLQCITVTVFNLTVSIEIQERRDQAIYYDARIVEIQRRMHDVRGCRCLILIRYDHDNSEVHNISAIACVMFPHVIHKYLMLCLSFSGTVIYKYLMLCLSFSGECSIEKTLSQSKTLYLE